MSNVNLGVSPITREFLTEVERVGPDNLGRLYGGIVEDCLRDIAKEISKNPEVEDFSGIPGIREAVFTHVIAEFSEPILWFDAIGLNPVYGYMWSGPGDVCPPEATAWPSIAAAKEELRAFHDVPYSYGKSYLILFSGEPDGDESRYGYPDHPDFYYEIGEDNNIVPY